MDPNDKPAIILGKKEAILVGILGLIIPIGIQDFVTHRYSWGILHLLSLILSPIAALFYIFDGYCEGGKECSSPPGVGCFCSSILLATAVVLLVLNLIECSRLISNRTITFSRKSLIITTTIFILIAAMLLFGYRIRVFNQWT